MADDNPTLCRCGCGLPTSLSDRTDTARGVIKGQPLAYVKGHTSRWSRTLSQRKPPRRRELNGSGTEFIHRLRAEKALGHPLPPGAEVHHPDRDRWNPDARLVICESSAYHHFLHLRMRVKAAGGDPNTQRICSLCRRLTLLTEMAYERVCRPCNNARNKLAREARLAQRQSKG